MTRLQAIQPENASGDLKPIYEEMQKKMGKIPNIFKHMANSPVTLQAFLNLSQSLNKTTLSPKVREQIALIVAEENHCNYCLSAHSAIGKGLDFLITISKGPVKGNQMIQRAMLFFTLQRL